MLLLGPVSYLKGLKLEIGQLGLVYCVHLHGAILKHTHTRTRTTKQSPNLSAASPSLFRVEEDEFLLHAPDEDGEMRLTSRKMVSGGGIPLYPPVRPFVLQCTTSLRSRVFASGRRRA